jgi:hypothetical protein
MPAHRELCKKFFFMSNSKIKVYLFLPYIRTLGTVTIGQFTFNDIDNIKKETRDTQDEILRIRSFFRQAEGRMIDVFHYLVLEETQEELNKIFVELRKSLEIFRYLTVDPQGKGLEPEHSTLYIIFPDPKNPWIHENEKHYMYKVTENFTKKERFVTHPHASERPPFVKEIYGESPPHIEEKLGEKLNENITESDLRAITWYNKTFSITAQDDKENLLRLSVAFETFFSLDEEEGKKEVLEKISEIVCTHIKSPDLEEKLKLIKPYVASRIIGRLADAVGSLTESESIKKWFKQHFYSVGSGIRHGDDVSELPKPVVSKNKLGMSLWYAGDASHEYLNNIYFGQRLFKFLFEERYFPYTEYIKQLSVQQLEALLMADEERLKRLETTVTSKKIGELTSEDLSIATSFRGSYYGSKERVLIILQKLLEELKLYPSVWSEIASYGEILLAANLKEEDFSDYEKTKPFYHALIEMGSILDKREAKIEITEEEMKLFSIKQFVEYSLHRLI